MKRNSYWINFIGRFFCFFLLAFFSSQSNAYPAASSYYDTVQKIFIGYYQRPADPGGLIYWADRLDKSGGNLGEIIEAFANSAEAQTLYGTINSSTISNVVNEIYITLFGRPAEPEGLDYYTNGFNTGRFTAATIMLNVLYGATQGDDYLSVTNKLTAANLFTRTIDLELDGKNFQVTYAGNSDVIAARNYLTLYATSVKVPTQTEITAYIKANIADLTDPILGQGSGQISIISVSSTSPTPLTPLTLATAGISNDPVSVTFFNSAGFSVSNTPIRVKTDGTVIVAVPLYVDPSTSMVSNGTVSLVLSQGSKVSAPVTIYIQNLPTLDTYGVQLGEVSHAFLNFRALLLGGRINQLQAASLLFSIDTSELQSALSDSLNAVLLAQSDVDSVMLNNSTVTTHGTLPNGTVIQWDKNAQGMMDRVIAVYLLQQFGNVTSKVTARSSLSSSFPEALALPTVADLKEILAVIEDSRTLPNLIRDIQKSETGEDGALAVLTAASACIPDSVVFLGEKELGEKLGAGFGIYAIGRAGIDAFYDLGSFLVDSKYGGVGVAQDRENLNKNSAKLLDAGISALTFGLIEGVEAGTPDSMPFLGLGLALRDAKMIKSLMGFEDVTTKFVAFQWPSFSSPSQGFGQITGTAPAMSSLNLCCLAASALGIKGIADSSGNYSMFVPLDVQGTNYGSLTLSAGDPITGSTLGSETVDLRGLDTSQPVQVPTLIPETKGMLMISTGGSGTVSSSPSVISCSSTSTSWGESRNCSSEVTKGTVVTLTATPAPGATFLGWFFDCTGTGSCTVTVDTPKVVMAIFSAEWWTGTWNGTYHYKCYNNTTSDYPENEPFSFEIQNGVLKWYDTDLRANTFLTIGTSGQVTFGNGTSLVFTGIINENAGTASGTWTMHNPGCDSTSGDGNGTWRANRN